MGAVVIAVADAATEWRAAAESMLADADALADAKARRDAEDRREYLAELARHLEHHRKAGIPEVVLPLVAAEACGQWWRHLGKSAAAVVPSGLTPTPAVTAIKRWLAGQTADGSPLDSPNKRVLCLLDLVKILYDAVDHLLTVGQESALVEQPHPGEQDPERL